MEFNVEHIATIKAEELTPIFCQYGAIKKEPKEI